VTRSSVVIADDDADIRGLIRIACVRADLRVTAEAADGVDALAAMTLDPPDLAVLDVSMPEMTGIEVCRRIRADTRLAGICILLVSAAVDERSVEAGFGAGADAYMQKPFSPRQLTARLRELVEQRA
jgi:DNA-binding response OmpR family regulator